MREVPSSNQNDLMAMMSKIMDKIDTIEKNQQTQFAQINTTITQMQSQIGTKSKKPSNTRRRSQFIQLEDDFAQEVTVEGAAQDPK